MGKNNLPLVSIIIPTYNCVDILPICLKSIEKQDYPKEELEVLFIDGFSDDGTRRLIKEFKKESKFKCKLLDNESIIAEYGKSIGIRNSNGEIIVLLDSDNEIGQEDWLSQMVKPLIENSGVFGVESFYLLKEDDFVLNKYFTLIELTDPLARQLFPKLEKCKRGKYIEYRIKDKIPPIGANGFLWRKSAIESVGKFTTEFEETNFISKVVDAGHKKFVKIEGYGVYHHYVKNFKQFVNKRVKIGKKFTRRKKKKQETWVNKVGRKDFLKAVLYCMSIIGPLLEALRGYSKTYQKAWLLHPIMCFLTILIYSVTFIEIQLEGLFLWGRAKRY